MTGRLTGSIVIAKGLIMMKSDKDFLDQDGQQNGPSYLKGRGA